MVVPFAAGGPVDTVGRAAAERMKVSLGQPIIIENVSGATGTIGVGRVARAAPDGYTLGIGNWSSHVANGALFALSYDLLKDLEPVTLISTYPLLISVRKSFPADDLKGLITWLKANPDKASQGTAGVGSGGHIAGVLFQSTTGTRYQFIPYRGSGPSMQDLVAGQIDMLIDGPVTTLPQLRAATIKSFAVTAKSRMAVAPEIPSVIEAGLPGFMFSNWHGLWLPKGTPKNIIDKLNGTVIEALADANVRARLADVAQEIFPREQQTPQALGSYHKAEIEKWWPIIRAANIKGE
jgi:tripartite-type tricarboxylate transporter receptor subunit TctC